MSVMTNNAVKILIEIARNEVSFFVPQGVFPPDSTPCKIRRVDMQDPAHMALMDRQPLMFVRMLFKELAHVDTIEVNAQALRVTLANDAFECEEALEYLRAIADRINALLIMDRLPQQPTQSYCYTKAEVSEVARSISWVDYPGSLFSGYTRQYRFSQELGPDMVSEIAPNVQYEAGGLGWVRLRLLLADTGAIRSVRISGRDVWVVANREHDRIAHHDTVMSALRQYVGWNDSEAIVTTPYSVQPYLYTVR